MKDFRQLKVWEKAHQLTMAVYHITTFPREQTYALASQMRRAASSIPSNIAEGCGRDGDAELSRFCSIARGSASELDCHLRIALDLEFMSEADHQKVAPQLTEIRKMLSSFASALTATAR